MQNVSQKRPVDRQQRALAQAMDYIVLDGDLQDTYAVQRIHEPGAGTTYTVDLRGGSCTCKDHEKVGRYDASRPCKHRIIVAWTLASEAPRPAPKPAAPKRQIPTHAQMMRDFPLD